MWVVRKARDHDVPITRMKELNSFISWLSEIALGIYVMHSGYKYSKCRTQGQSVVIDENVLWARGRSKITVSQWQNFGCFGPTPCINIFYGMNVDIKCTLLDHLPRHVLKRSLWTTPTKYSSMTEWTQLLTQGYPFPFFLPKKYLLIGSSKCDGLAFDKIDNLGQLTKESSWVYLITSQKRSLLKTTIVATL